VIQTLANADVNE